MKKTQPLIDQISNYQKADNEIALIEHSLRYESVGRVRAQLAKNGALCVHTGGLTGRSPGDRYIVRGRLDSEIAWNMLNKPLERSTFERMLECALGHISNLRDPLFYQDDLCLTLGEHHVLPIKVFTQYAWHALFARTMFVRNTTGEQHNSWTMLVLPRFKPNLERDGISNEGIIAIDFDNRVILIGNKLYGGEMWKAVFTVVNTLLPLKGVLTMHCGANSTKDGVVTIFFGLSGTGKTTLSTDEGTLLIGDDGHCWGKSGIQNLAGGCYAKLHDITPEREPTIWNALGFGTVMENVVLDNDRQPLYERGPENIRGVYGLERIAHTLPRGFVKQPDVIIILTCDMSGVLPPIAVLSPEQAAFHYLAGYTTKVGSTEVGSSELFSPTMSAFLGEPFFPLHYERYLTLFMQRLEEHRTPVYLVNTGWIGGPMGNPSARRISIATSRAIIHAAQRGEVRGERYLPEHGLYVPKEVYGVEARNLTPEDMWEDKSEYHKACTKLWLYIETTMRKKFPDLTQEIMRAGVPARH